MSGERRVRVLVSGVVQGVFFRDHTRRWAEELGLRGWVRNLDDGRVEAVAEGREERIREFIGRLRRGSPSSRVDDLEVEWGEGLGEFPDFRVLRGR